MEANPMIPLCAIKNSKRLFKEAVDQITPEILGSVIDHTLLNPAANVAHIGKLCREANEIGSFICVNGSRITDARVFYINADPLKKIRGIVAVAGFPFGAELTKEKEAGAFSALVDAGADEVDIVLNIGKLIDGYPFHNNVYCDIYAVAMAVKRAQKKSGKKKILKVIQENCCLDKNQKHLATTLIVEVAAETNVHMFAKTSTGFGTPKDDKTPKGATLEDVWNMNFIRKTRKKGLNIGIKAAGGISDAETAVKMMLAGGCFDDNIKLVENPSDVFRIGTSAGKKIVDDLRQLRKKLGLE